MYIDVHDVHDVHDAEHDAERLPGKQCAITATPLIPTSGKWRADGRDGRDGIAEPVHRANRAVLLLVRYSLSITARLC